MNNTGSTNSKKMNSRQLRDALLLYAVTDSRWLGGESLTDKVAEVASAGATCVQLREKDIGHRELVSLAKNMKNALGRSGAPLIVNDDAIAAVASGADGAHIGQSDADVKEARATLGPDKILGVSVRTVEQARLAQDSGADYLGVGAVFPTGTKSDADSCTYENLRQICAAVDIPVVAIGGIDKNNIGALAGSGICGVAVVSAIFAEPDAARASREMLALATAYFSVAPPSAASRFPAPRSACPCNSGPRSSAHCPTDLKKVLTIAGSDCSGGAGIQADIKTISAHGAYAMSVITALVAENTVGVYGVYDVDPEFVGQQLNSVFTDIFPDAVKIGMVSSAAIAEVIAERLVYYHAKNIVLDPVMVATNGGKLYKDGAMEAVAAKLFPLADIITPNSPEAEALGGVGIERADDMPAAASRISAALKRTGAVLIKGGHFEDGSADDLLYAGGKTLLIKGARIGNPNTHGTGCTLSSAIACNLADGHDVADSVRLAKAYVTGAIAAGLNIGHGRGPLNHQYGYGYK